MDEPTAVRQVFNIGSTEETSNLILAQRVKELTGSLSEIIFVPYDEAYEEGFEDIPRRVPDLAKISDLISYTPTVTLDHILASVIEHQQAKAGV